jgi:hypothetical protein
VNSCAKCCRICKVRIDERNEIIAELEENENSTMNEKIFFFWRREVPWSRKVNINIHDKREEIQKMMRRILKVFSKSCASSGEDRRLVE